MLSLANILLWFAANAWRREFLSFGELGFVSLEGDLSLSMRLEMETTTGKHGTVRRLDRAVSLEWVISEDCLPQLALLIHGLDCFCDRTIQVFHVSPHSSFARPVHDMWNLCNTTTKSKLGPGSTGSSEEFGTDF